MTVDTHPQDVLVLGFDGVPWSLIERWTDDGSLPNFARLREEGASGPLASTTPASTPLAWPSIATGVRPDKHGVYWFRRLTEGYTHRTNTSEDVRRPALWDVVSPAVVGNVPMTYPAGEIDGAMVSGMMTPCVDADGFTHPPSLAEEIHEEIPSYRIGLDWTAYTDDLDGIVSDISDLVDARAALLWRLLDRDWRLGFFVFTAPDRLQHLVWDETVLREHYQRLDGILGDVLARVDERDATLFVVSDHGFGPVSTIVSGDAVLERAGYLARSEGRNGAQNLLGRMGITKDAVTSWLGQVGVDRDELVTYLPQGFVDMVAFQIPGEHAIYDVDHERTTAFFHGSGCLYVNDTDRFEDGVVAPEDVDGLKRELTHLFARVTDPETGERVLRVADGDVLFPTDPRSPDLVVKGIDGYETQTRLTDDVLVDAETKAAGHRPEGILLAYGPDVAAGARPEAMSVVDVAPTILHAMDRPVPAGADGRVLTELFDPASEPFGREPRTRRYAPDGPDADGEGPGASGDDEDFEAVEERLRGLGYVE